MSPKVLIIEDDIFSANRHRVHLSKAGFETQIASDGRQALEIADSFKPNLIILDLILPKIDGFSVLQLFRSTRPHRQIPIIIISDLSQPEDIDKCISAGAKEFYSKGTLDYPKLIDCLYSLLPSTPSIDSHPPLQLTHI